MRIPGAATKEEVEAGVWRKVAPAVGARERTVMEAMAAVGAAWNLRLWIEADNWVWGREIIVTKALYLISSKQLSRPW